MKSVGLLSTLGLLFKSGIISLFSMIYYRFKKGGGRLLGVYVGAVYIWPIGQNTDACGLHNYICSESILYESLKPECGVGVKGWHRPSFKGINESCAQTS